MKGDGIHYSDSERYSSSSLLSIFGKSIFIISTFSNFIPSPSTSVSQPQHNHRSVALFHVLSDKHQARF
ncbi:unnamed protein product [Rhodiola kirilowii]